MTNVKKSLVKSSAIITIFLIISKITGVIRELLIASQFGAGSESDIFKTATKIPNLFLSCIAAALVVTFIPVFSGIKNDKKAANKFFNNILNIVLILCAILSILGIIYSSQLTTLFASGFKENAFSRTSNMTKIVMPSIIFLSISGLYTGYLQSYGNFIQPAMTGIVANILLIIAIVIFGRFGIIAAIIAFLVSAVVQVLVQRPFMGDYKYEFYVNLHDENIKRLFKLSLPILISTAVAQINVIVDSTFASSLVEGSISVVDYAGRICSLINQVFIVSITTILYPMLTEKFSMNDQPGFEELLEKSINIVIIIAIPLIFGLAVLSTPVVVLLLQHGKFNSSSTEITSLCLKYLVFSALGNSLFDILGKVFFSVKDTVTPMINGFIMIGLNIILIFVLVPRLGVNGLALATTISACVIALIMLLELKFKLKFIKFKSIVIILLKTLFSGAVMSIIIYELYNYLDVLIKSNSIVFLSIKLVIVILIGVGIYLAMLILFKVKEIETIVNLKKKNNN